MRGQGLQRRSVHSSPEGRLTPSSYARLRQNRERIRRAAHRHGARNVRIFGSVVHDAVQGRVFNRGENEWVKCLAR